MFSELFDGAIDLVTSPIEVAKDVLPLGGVLNKQDESYTERRLRKLKEDAEDVLNEI
jgi:hypothetical protein